MRLKSRVGSLVNRLLYPCFAAIFLIWAYTVRPAGRQLVFCPTPIISNRYWVEALREGGENAVTLMSGHYSVNRKEDFDLYYSDLVPGWVPSRFRADVGPLFASLYLLREASVVHIPFTGGPLGPTRLWRWESKLLKRAGIKIVVLPYGGDAYMYSQVIDTSLRHGLLLSYPAAARREPDIHQRVESWNLDADAVICGFMVDGMARWDVLRLRHSVLIFNLGNRTRTVGATGMAPTEWSPSFTLRTIGVSKAQSSSLTPWTNFDVRACLSNCDCSSRCLMSRCGQCFKR